MLYPRATLNFYLTWKCNFKCDHCIHLCDKNGEDMTKEKLEMSLDIARQLIKYDKVIVPCIGISGGEPTISKHFETILSFLREIKYNSNIVLELHTNGSYWNRKINVYEYQQLFNNIYIPHDIFHEPFRKGKKNSIKYQHLSILGNIRIGSNDYKYKNDKGDLIRGTFLRAKGRATDLLKFNSGIVDRQECIFDTKTNASDMVINFTPDNITFCGESSHDRCLSSTIEYDKKLIGNPEKLIKAAVEHRFLHTSHNCSDTCRGFFMDIDKYLEFKKKLI